MRFSQTSVFQYAPRTGPRYLVMWLEVRVKGVLDSLLFGMKKRRGSHALQRSAFLSHDSDQYERGPSSQTVLRYMLLHEHIVNIWHFIDFYDCVLRGVLLVKRRWKAWFYLILYHNTISSLEQFYKVLWLRLCGHKFMTDPSPKVSPFCSCWLILWQFQPPQ